MQQCSQVYHTSPTPARTTVSAAQMAVELRPQHLVPQRPAHQAPDRGSRSSRPTKRRVRQRLRPRSARPYRRFMDRKMASGRVRAAAAQTVVRFRNRQANESPQRSGPELLIRMSTRDAAEIDRIVRTRIARIEREILHCGEY